jgi:hypothetical protein
MAGFEVLRQVQLDNAAAAAEEARQAEAQAASDPYGTGLREGVPVELWRAASVTE